MIQPLVQRYRIAVAEPVSQPTEDGLGTITVEGPKKEHVVEVTINLDHIVRILGARAVRSVKGQARSGPVRVRVVRDKKRGGQHG